MTLGRSCRDCGRFVPEKEYKRQRCRGCYLESERIRNRGRVRSRSKKRTLDTGRWKRVREQVMRRDDNRCRVCGGTQGLGVHHVIPREEQPELAFAPYNLVTLCRAHHERAEREGASF